MTTRLTQTVDIFTNTALWYLLVALLNNGIEYNTVYTRSSAGNIFMWNCADFNYFVHLKKIFYSGGKKIEITYIGRNNIKQTNLVICVYSIFT